MDAQPRTRSCCRERIPPDEGTPRGSKQMCMPMTRDSYEPMWDDPGAVQRFLEPLIHTSPELLPEGMTDGLQRTGCVPEVMARQCLLIFLSVRPGCFILCPFLLDHYIYHTTNALGFPRLDLLTQPDPGFRVHLLPILGLRPTP